MMNETKKSSEDAELAQKPQMLSQFDDVMHAMPDPNMSFLEKTRPGPKIGHQRKSLINQSPINVPTKPSHASTIQSDEKQQMSEMAMAQSTIQFNNGTPDKS